MNQEQIVENLKKCPSFNSCNQNLCPLNLELNSSRGGKAEKCRWMREPQKKKIKGREFMSGGSVMPDGLLIFVPQCNLRWLNESSQTRWKELQT